MTERERDSELNNTGDDRKNRRKERKKKAFKKNPKTDGPR